MIRSTLFAAVLSLTTFSVASALPSMTTAPREPSGSVVQVGQSKGHNKGNKGHYSKHKNWNKHHAYNNWNHHGRYHYGGRYWGHRYNYRPYGWATLGCIAVGPIWYCP
jgi:hypothetical protein